MKKYFIPLFLGSVLIGAGIVLTIFEFSLFTYINTLPPHNFEKQEEATYYTIHNKDLYIRVIGNNYHIVKDETLNDQVKVEFNYYPDFIMFDRVDVEKATYREIKIKFSVMHNSSAFYGELFNLVSSDLKARRLHNYIPLFQPYVEITTNPNDMSKIKIIRY